MNEKDLSKDGSISIIGYVWDTTGCKPDSERGAGELPVPPWKEIEVRVKISDLEKLGFRLSS